MIIDPVLSYGSSNTERKVVVETLVYQKPGYNGRTWVGTGQRNVRRGLLCQQDRTQRNVVLCMRNWGKRAKLYRYTHAHALGGDQAC
jgi:hypothetical protein